MIIPLDRWESHFAHLINAMDRLNAYIEEVYED
jgi:hypothetical protein